MDFENEFLRKNPKRGNVLKLMREAIGKDRVEFEDLTAVNLTRVRDHICESVTGNSACTYLAVIKATLSPFASDGVLPCKNPHDLLKAKHVPSQHIALTEEEVAKLDAYEPWSETEQNVKILFMRGCYTGARSSDCKRFTPDIIRGDHIAYVSQKTKTEVIQPLHHALVKYLYVQPTYIPCPSVLNRTIQRICEYLGFDEEVTLFVGGKLQKGPKWQFVSSHTARRSFCTNLALRGAPIDVIARLAGHTNSLTTSKHYICIDTKNLGSEALSFFN